MLFRTENELLPYFYHVNGISFFFHLELKNNHENVVPVCEIIESVCVSVDLRVLSVVKKKFLYVSISILSLSP